MSCKKIGLLFWRSTSQQQKNTPKIHEFCPDDIFWFVDSFTTKLGMVMRHHEPDCLRKRLIFCLQGQGHTEGSYSQNMTFCMSSELLTLLQLNLVWWHIIISWIVLWKDWIALMWSRSRSQERFRIPVTEHLDSTYSTAEPCVARLYCLVGIYSMGNLCWFPWGKPAATRPYPSYGACRML